MKSQIKGLLTVFSLLLILSIFSFSHTIKSDILEANTNNANFIISHGHCNTPFSGRLKDLKMKLTPRSDNGNPLEGMQLDFEIDPLTFNHCSDKKITERIQRKNLFHNENHKTISFKSKDVYTLGIDWYQMNGRLNIKGVENDFKLFITGIRQPKNQYPSKLVFEGEINLFDYEIDYDNLIFGDSNSLSSNILRINFTLGL